MSEMTEHGMAPLEVLLYLNYVTAPILNLEENHSLGELLARQVAAVFKVSLDDAKAIVYRWLSYRVSIWANNETLGVH